MIINERLKKVLYSGIVFSFIAHFFGIINIIKNYDNIAVKNGYGASLIYGRWFLKLLADFNWKLLGSWNLQFFNNVIALGILTISAYLFIIIFDIKENKYIVLSTGLFLTFPTVTSIIFFPYISIYYSISILFIFLGVFLNNKYKLGWILTIVFTTLSLGIYQANFSIMVSLNLLILIQQILKNNYSFQRNVKLVIKYIIILLISIFIYFIILKTTLFLSGEKLLNYDGLNLTSALSFSNIFKLIFRTYKEVLFLPFNNVYGLSPSLLLSICIFCILFFDTILFIKLLSNTDILKNKVLSILIFITYPIAIDLPVVMVSGTRIYTLMVYSFIFIFIMPIVFLNEFNNTKSFMISILKKMVFILLSLSIYGYSYFSNVNYTAMYYTTMQTQNYLNQIVLQIKMQKGFNENMRWIFVGNIRDQLIFNPWAEGCLYGGNLSNYYNDYSRVGWIEHYLGYYPPVSYLEDYEKENDIDIIKKMPLYPNDGSIKIINNYVIVKFSEI